MVMVKKSITVTNQQENWIQSQMATGLYATDSEVIREALREKQTRCLEVLKIQAMLVEAEEAIEKHGFSDKTTAQIKQEVLRRKGADGTL